MIISFIQRAIMQGIPLMFGSTGEIVTEKSGHLNLGIPGIMYVGGISGVIGAFLYEQSVTGPLNPFWAILIPLLSILNRFAGEIGLVYAQPTADTLSLLAGICIYTALMRKFRTTSQPQ